MCVSPAVCMAIAYTTVLVYVYRTQHFSDQSSILMIPAELHQCMVIGMHPYKPDILLPDILLTGGLMTLCYLPSGI